MQLYYLSYLSKKVKSFLQGGHILIRGRYGLRLDTTLAAGDVSIIGGHIALDKPVPLIPLLHTLLPPIPHSNLNRKSYLLTHTYYSVYRTWLLTEALFAVAL